MIVLSLLDGLLPSVSINKQLKYGLDINGGVYVLLQANTKATGSDLEINLWIRQSVLENRVNAMGIFRAAVS